MRHRAIKKFLSRDAKRHTREGGEEERQQNATFFVHMEKRLSDVMANYKMEL